MVVTRRQSVSPPIPPAASRTNSSPGLSRLTKGKDLDKSSPLKPSSINSSSTPQNSTLLERPQVGPRTLEDITFDDEPGPKPTSVRSPAKSRTKQKSKKLKAKKQDSNKGIRGFDIVARVFLVWLTIYTLSVCPDDTQLRSPICRALTQYRRTILEPYIIPPIRATLEHPAVMPHIQRVQPYYYRTIEASTPMVRFVKREWQNKVVPQMRWLQLRAQPYVLRVTEQYNLAVGPYVELVSDSASRFRHKADPYVLAAASKSRQGWETAWPYLMPIWREAKRLPGSAAVHIGRPLGEARRQWVDPHVAKIWDTIMEKSGAGTRIVMSTPKSATFASTNPSLTSPVLSAAETTSAVLAEKISQTTSTPSMSPPNPKPTDEATAPTSSIIEDSASIVSSSPSTHSTTAPSGVVDGVVAASVETEQSPITTSTTVHDTPESINTRSEEDPEDADGKSSRFAGDEEEVQPSSEGTTDPISDYDEDTEDLDAFLAELETGSDSEPAEPPPPPPAPPQEHEETQEELEERIRRVTAEYAHVRAEIEARHTKWETELERVGKTQRKVVRTTLKTLRDAASQEARAADGPVRTPIETLNREAERSLRSVKSFARKLATEDKSRDEKARSLELIVQKVDKKFVEHVDTAAQAIRAWLDVQNELESREISNIAAQVTNVADRAQDDLGMDYTWLPGVTLDDWKRYHKLQETSKGFHEWYSGMQNGTVPNAPPNPVIDIMEAIQEEVDDMILGFDSSLGRIKAEAISSYGHVSAGFAARNTPGEETSAQGAEAPASESVPKVSIHRVNPDNAKEDEAIPPVILSRGKEEIMSAASRAEEAEKRAASHAEL